jgi:hypothetical protein
MSRVDKLFRKLRVAIIEEYKAEIVTSEDEEEEISSEEMKEPKEKKPLTEYQKFASEHLKSEISTKRTIKSYSQFVIEIQLIMNKQNN